MHAFVYAFPFKFVYVNICEFINAYSSLLILSSAERKIFYFNAGKTIPKMEGSVSTF